MKDFTLEQSMNLAGQCCLAWLNPERDFMPTGGYDELSTVYSTQEYINGQYLTISNHRGVWWAYDVTRGLNSVPVFCM